MANLIALDPGAAAAFANADLSPAPELLPSLEPLLAGWNQLGADRRHTTQGVSGPMGGMMIVSRPAPIPWTAVRMWCDVHHIHGEEAEFVTECFAAMDAEFIACWSEQQEKAMKR